MNQEKAGQTPQWPVLLGTETRSGSQDLPAPSVKVTAWAGQQRLAPADSEQARSTQGRVQEGRFMGCPPFTCSRGHSQGQAAQGWRAPWGRAVTLRGGVGFEPCPAPVDAGRPCSLRLPAGPLRARSSAEAARPAGVWSSGACEGSGGQSPALQVWLNVSTRPRAPSALASGGPCPRLCTGPPGDLERPLTHCWLRSSQ